MSCPEIDLKAFVLGEVQPSGRASIEAHLEACAACREETERLSLTVTALRAIPEEEVPRRIAFVSDKVFEPKWWQVWLNSTPRMALVGSALLAVAIVVHGFTQPVVPAAPAVNLAAMESRIQGEIAARLDEAVKKALVESEARQAEKLQAALSAAEKRFDFERQADRVQVEEAFNVMRKQMTRWYLASNETGGLR